jgi:hypothetical protein
MLASRTGTPLRGLGSLPSSRPVSVRSLRLLCSSAKVTAAADRCSRPLTRLLPPLESFSSRSDRSRCPRQSRCCASAIPSESSAAPIEPKPDALPPTWLVALFVFAFCLLCWIPPVRESLMKYVQTGEAIVSIFSFLVVGGYALFRRFDTYARAASAAAEKDRAVLLDTNRKSSGFALWRASHSDGLRRVYTASPSLQPLPAILLNASQLHERILGHELYSAYAPLFLAKALDGASLPTLGAAQLVECGVRAEHAPGLAAFLVTLCENSAV